MSRAHPAADVARAVANVGGAVQTLIGIAETLDADRRLIVQQVAWAIQDELEAISRFAEQDDLRTPPDVTVEGNVTRLKPKNSSGEGSEK